MKRWYAIHAHTGQENRVRDNLTKIIEKQDLQDKIGQVLVPSEEVAEVKGGRKRVTTRKFFPGYVLVQLDLDDEIWTLVKEIPGVSGFIGAGRKAVPLEDEEVQIVIEQMRGESKRPKPKVTFERGDKVKVTEGPFTNFIGTIEEINSERGRVKLMVEIFERLTPLELEFWQLERV